MNEQEAAWLARTREEPIDPDQEICDPHHHLWDYPDSRYMLAELHGDTGAGHNVTSTVFVECASGYRDGGPEEMRVVAEAAYVLEVA
ncbi:MAG: amidohydrolase, partial [Holophagales bacterium]|nr:amidohydrolase [Holophagales bacterium]